MEGPAIEFTYPPSVLYCSVDPRHTPRLDQFESRLLSATKRRHPNASSVRVLLDGSARGTSCRVRLPDGEPATTFELTLVLLAERIISGMNSS